MLGILPYMFRLYDYVDKMLIKSACKSPNFIDETVAS